MEAEKTKDYKDYRVVLAKAVFALEKVNCIVELILWKIELMVWKIMRTSRTCFWENN